MMQIPMWHVVAHFGLLATAILLALLVGEYALLVRPTRTSTLLGTVAAVVLAISVALGRTFLRRSTEHA